MTARGYYSVLAARRAGPIEPDIRPRRECIEGTVYFARCRDYIKIGFAASVKQRLRDLQIGCPEPIELVGWMRGTQRTERNLHHGFRKLHVRGEWFRADPKLLEYIRRVTPAGAPGSGTFRDPPEVVDGPENFDPPPRRRR